MLVFLNVLQYLVLSLWVGAMFAFGALYAPVLFRSLKSRDQAGTIAGETLARIDTLGLVTGGIMLVITAMQFIDGGTRGDGAGRATDLGRLLIAAVMVALVAYNTISVRGKIAAIRQQMGKPIDELAENDPLRVEHGKYHRISRGLFTLNLMLGTLLIVLSALRPQ